ncbi:MAG: outer membrane lipoprotein-sorting protein [Candidatus Auribacter fodinae]|jgi:outer membrane lipoprotein-sorting protein|uniref:Outer membrane lipoprotein-sorting protein n=1 Tax=Candidatus Auribacter fodinae TaxID=2093366 RepID=A0A3A4QZN7_9BACT|nr:MAG: outer membrane lipoprotein-sorting protein [Candidatus Auribacter fodinae]
MKYRAMSVLTAVSLLTGITCLQAQETMTVDEIVTKANHTAYYGGDDGKARVHMVITDKLGRTRERDFTILRKDLQDGGEQKFYVYFNDPSDVRKMVYMVWKHIGSDDDRWLYLPALDLVRRVAASDRRSSFVGSHFVYEDVSGRSIEEDTHTLEETTDEFFKIKNVPKDPSIVEFSYYYIWIDKENFMPVKAEYYNKQDTLYRKVEALQVEDIQGIPTVTKSQVTDIEAGGNTVSTFSEVQYNVGIDESIFTERYLRRPPREWIR